MNELNVITDGDSPRGWQRYVLLHSPKTGLVSRSKLPFVFLYFGLGLIIGGTLNQIGMRTTPGCVTFPTIQPNAHAEINVDKKANSFRGREHSVTDSFPVAWLMSFPVSTSVTNCFVRQFNSNSWLRPNFWTQSITLSVSFCVQTELWHILH